MRFISRSLSLSNVITVLSANFLSAFAWGSFAPIFALIVVDRGGDASDVGLIWGGYTLLTGFLMLFFGRFEDEHHETKRLLVLGTVFQALAPLLLITMNSLEGLILAQVVFGIGFGAGMPALKAIYGKLLDKGREASEWAYMEGGNMLVMSVAALAGGFIYEYATPEILFTVMSVMFSMSALMFAVLVKTMKT